DDDLIETGILARKRGKQLPKNMVGTWKVRVDTADIEPGFYRFLLVARDSAGIPLAEARSPAIRVETDLDAPDPVVRPSFSVPAARLQAQRIAFGGSIHDEHIVTSVDAKARY